MPVDLNADLGESYGRWRLGDDEVMLSMITSANVACGFHACDPATLERTCRAAVERGVVIGAQVGYPDLLGFGRRFLDIAADDLQAAVIYQIGALDALTALDDRLPLLGLPGSAVLALAERRGLRTVTEYFVDRAYTADGRLVDRRRPDALITDVAEAADRAVAAARRGDADSMCIHGDSPDAVAMARAVRTALHEAGIATTAFVAHPTAR